MARQQWSRLRQNLKQGLYVSWLQICQKSCGSYLIQKAICYAWFRNYIISVSLMHFVLTAQEIWKVGHREREGNKIEASQKNGHGNKRHSERTWEGKVQKEKNRGMRKQTHASWGEACRKWSQQSWREKNAKSSCVGLLAPRSPKTNSSQSDTTSQLMAESIKL